MVTGCMLPFARLQTNEDRDGWWHWAHRLAKTPTRYSLCCWSHGCWFRPQLTMEITHVVCTYRCKHVVWWVMEVWKYLQPVHDWNLYVFVCYLTIDEVNVACNFDVLHNHPCFCLVKVLRNDKRPFYVQFVIPNTPTIIRGLFMLGNNASNVHMQLQHVVRCSVNPGNA